MLSTPLLADVVARLLAATTDPWPRPVVRFPEIAGRTTTVSIPPGTATQWRRSTTPNPPVAGRRCTSTSTGVGSSAGTVNRTIRGAASWPRMHYAVLDLVTKTKDKASPVGRAAVLWPSMTEVFAAAYIPDPARRRNRLASPAWGTNGDDLVGIAPALSAAPEASAVTRRTYAFIADHVAIATASGRA